MACEHGDVFSAEPQPILMSISSCSKMEEEYRNVIRGWPKDVNEESSHVCDKYFDKEAFIEAVRSYRCLWDTNDITYKDRAMKVNAWKELSGYFEQDVTILQRTLENLKDNFKRCLDRRHALSRSGAVYTSLRTYQYLEQMAFLYQRNATNQTDYSVELPMQSAKQQRGLSQSIPSLLSPGCSAPSPSSSCNDAPNKGKPRANAAVESADPFLPQTLLKNTDYSLLTSIAERSKSIEIDEATSYCNNLIPVLQGFSKRNMRLAKMKIDELLYEIEFGDKYTDL